MKNNLNKAIQELLEGKFVILYDEYKEKEGDLICAASKINASQIHFATRNACGVPVLSVSYEISKKLNLIPQKRDKVTNNCAMYAQTIDAAYGLTGGGCSTYDRALTCNIVAKFCEYSIYENDKKIANNNNDDNDNNNLNNNSIVTPGHVLPVIAQKNTIKDRQGHTEASIELMKKANLPRAAYLCEILNEEGNTADYNFLLNFAKKHNITIISMKDLL